MNYNEQLQQIIKENDNYMRKTNTVRKQYKFKKFEDYLIYNSLEELICEKCNSSNDLLTNGSNIWCRNCHIEFFEENFKVNDDR